MRLLVDLDISASRDKIQNGLSGGWNKQTISGLGLLFSHSCLHHPLPSDPRPQVAFPLNSFTSSHSLHRRHSARSEKPPHFFTQSHLLAYRALHTEQPISSSHVGR